MSAPSALSFCIVTGGQRQALLATVIQSIRAQQVPSFEILVVGRHRNAPGLRYLAAEAAADAGRLGAMRNLAVASARFERIVMLDDDIVLAPDWYARLEGAPVDADVVTCQLRVPDGSRYWDRATCGGPQGHRMLDPDESDDHVYMTGGGAWIARRDACARVRWDEERALYQNEDIDFSERLRAAGLRIAHQHASIAYHVAPQYTAVGRSVIRRKEGRSADWVEQLRSAPAEELAGEIQRLFREGSIAELGDALRLACRIHPGIAGFRRAWADLESLHGGALRDARWTSGLDPELARTLALHADAAEPVATLPRVRARAGAAPEGVNLFGFLSGNLGLGVAARAYLRLLVDRGVPVHAVDIRVNNARRIDEPLPVPLATGYDPAPHGVNLLVLNPDDVVLIARAPALGAPGSRQQICVPFWELTQLPPSWIPTLARMDVVAAPSQMIRHAALAAVAGPRVAYWPLPVYLPERAGPDRRRFGLSDDETVFVAAFEMASDMNRKNPLGTIEAFRRAFPAGYPARLVIKVNNGRESIPHLHALIEAARRDPRILVFDKVLDYRDVLSLYASADALVSLHRAEGFGLCMAEAMSLGVPVIATAWSGNMDFMCERNACLVRYTLEPVRATNQAAYKEEYTGPGARWADPDLDDAARWMRILAEDPELRSAIGKRAASDMAARQAGLGVDEILQALAHVHRRA